MESVREWVEGFLRGRYGVRVAALVKPALIGAVLVAGWFLVVPLLTIPRFTSEGPVVRNGVAAVVVCGKKSGPMNEKGIMATMKYAPEPRTGTWAPEQRGTCTVWYHRPPEATQRYNRHQRAANLSAPLEARGEMLRPEGVRISAEGGEIEKLPLVEKLKR